MTVTAFDSLTHARYRRREWLSRFRRAWRLRSAPWMRREARMCLGELRYWTGRLNPKIDVEV